MNQIKQRTVSIASIPNREKSLYKTVNSLINQVDSMNVFLNGYIKIPNFLKDNTRINVKIVSEKQDLGDIGKFYFSESIKGYHFTCDDDIIYPNDYINFMVEKLKKHGGFISCHGAIFNYPFSSFYDSKTTFHFRKKVNNDISVNLVGTGVMAYDSDKIKVPIEIFKNKNMADVYIAIFAKNNNISCTVVAHDNNYIKDYYLENLSKNFLINKFQKVKNKLILDNIYNSFKNKDVIQTNLIKKNQPWNIIENQKIDFFSFKYYSLNFKKNIIKSKVFLYGKLNEHIYKNILKKKMFYENDLLVHLANTIIKKNNCISIDVGANIGNHSIFFGKYLSDKVIAIEPSSINYEILKRNLSTNLKSDNYEALKLAVGKIEGNVQLVYPNDYNLGMAKVAKSDRKEDVTEDVKISTIDKILINNNIKEEINLIKIDVEGLEIDVLKGAEKTISKHCPHIIVEAHNEEKLNIIKEYLFKFNYIIVGKFCKTPTYHFIKKDLSLKKNKLISHKILLAKFLNYFSIFKA